MKKTRYEKIQTVAVPDDLPPDVRKKLWEKQQQEICRSKHRYLTADAAEMRAGYYDNDSKRTRRSSKKSRIYKCPWCGFFHLTTARSGQ